MATIKNLSAHVDLLGKTARDKVSGYQGVVVTVAFDLFGCVQAILKPPVDKDGKIQDGHFFDVNRLEIVDAPRVMPVPEYASKPAEHKHGPAEKPRSRNQ